jgi:hypothetical protein
MSNYPTIRNVLATGHNSMRHEQTRLDLHTRSSHDHPISLTCHRRGCQRSVARILLPTDNKGCIESLSPANRRSRRRFSSDPWVWSSPSVIFTPMFHAD